MSESMASPHRNGGMASVPWFIPGTLMRQSLNPLCHFFFFTTISTLTLTKLHLSYYLAAAVAVPIILVLIVIGNKPHDSPMVS